MKMEKVDKRQGARSTEGADLRPTLYRARWPPGPAEETVPQPQPPAHKLTIND